MVVQNKKEFLENHYYFHFHYHLHQLLRCMLLQLLEILNLLMDDL